MANFIVPTFEQVVALPTQVEATVQPEWIDTNGHMNINHYFDLGGDTSWAGCRELGLDELYQTDPPTGFFTTEHHLTYLSEMHLGERLTGHLRFVDIGPKSIHLTSILVDRSKEKVAYINELVMVHVDMTTRRAAPIQDFFASAFTAKVEEDRKLDWPAPVSGAMGVRRAVGSAPAGTRAGSTGAAGR
ncbi:thioesterase family protein [Brevibacterium daeguense]|uniref:Thioesterase family protein n=1 Tax=Brevibacterium daeguense TaxID=909936 RepID=A0ABP8EIV9_9MICO|nr:thioesterase family protein [Brevibacterium daeguense]